MTTDNDAIAELRRLLANSTPGVWKLWGMQVLSSQDGTSNVDTAVPVADTYFRDEHRKPRTWDADFMAAAHNLLPDLLDRLESAEADAREARAREAVLVERLGKVKALAVEWDACDEHGNPLREGSLSEAADDLRAALGSDQGGEG